MSEKISQADVIVQLASESYSFHRSPEGDLFALPVLGPKIARPLRGSRSLRAELASLFAQRQKKAPSSQALTDALLVLEGRALRGETLETHLRVAPGDGGDVVLDLGDDDGKVIIVGPGGWEVAYAPIVFRRSRLTRPLPVPERPGDLARLREFVNVDDESWPLLVAWCVSCLIASRPAPILELPGEHGSAKTTTARMLVRLIDPCAAETRGEPRDATDWAVAAAGSWVVALDNVSRIQPWLSDALCRAITGDGLVRRQLYTDSDVSVIAFKRRIILTSIDLGALRGDLADRLLRVNLERIPEERRLEEEQLEGAWAECHAIILGGLLDLAAGVLKVLPDVHLERRPRMADFGRILAAVDRVLGTTGYETYIARSRQVLQDVIDGDLVGVALRTHLEENGNEITATAAEILKAITPEKPPKGWPDTAQGMGQALKRLAPSFRAAGYEVEQLKRIRGGRPWRFQMGGANKRHKRQHRHDQGKHVDDQGDVCDVSSGQTSQTSTHRHGVSAGSAGNDVCDDVAAPLSGHECCEGGGPLQNWCQVCPKSPTYHRDRGTES